jgi:CheY-like chemotaxis protein
MKKIVLIEDNPDHALLIRKGVEGSDCSVVHFEDGPSAIETCKGFKNPEERPDLVLLDMKLPGLDGFGVLEQLKQLGGFERIPVVMLTTSSRKTEIDHAYQLGVSGYVVKSDDFDEFKNKLKRLKDYWFHTVELPTKNGDGV